MQQTDTGACTRAWLLGARVYTHAPAPTICRPAQYSTVQYSTVQHNIVQYSALQLLACCSPDGEEARSSTGACNSQHAGVTKCTAAVRNLTSERQTTTRSWQYSATQPSAHQGRATPQLGKWGRQMAAEKILSLSPMEGSR